MSAAVNPLSRYLAALRSAPVKNVSGGWGGSAAALRVVVLIAVYIVAFAAVSALLRPAAPFPAVPGIAAKLAHFTTHADRYDTVFVGSSRFYRQIIPRLFDQRLTAVTGRSTRSFNFGFDGMWPPESFYLTRQLLALRPPKLRWVVIEMMEIRSDSTPANRDSLRRAYWHDWRHTRLALADVGRSKWPWLKKARIAADHARHFVAHWGNFGRGAEFLRAHLAVVRKSDAAREIVPDEGFRTSRDTALQPAELARFLELKAQLPATFEPQPLHSLFRNALAELIRDVRSSGAEPIFVLTPMTGGSDHFVDAPEDAPVLVLNDPSAQPALFEPQLYVDPFHLNAEGAAVFTGLLAEGVASTISNSRPAPPPR